MSTQPNEKNAVSNTAFRLNGPRDPNDKSKKPDNVSFSMFNNQLSLSCFTERGNVFFNLDVVMATDLIDQIRACARSDSPRQQRWEVRGYDKNTRKKEVRGTIIVGRNERDECFLAIAAAGWDKPTKFTFRPHYDFRPMDASGNYIDERQYSSIVANNFANALYDTYIGCLVKDYRHPEPRGNNGGGGGYRNPNGGGSYGGNNYNSGGGNNSQPGAPANFDFDVDII